MGECRYSQTHSLINWFGQMPDALQIHLSRTQQDLPHIRAPVSAKLCAQHF
jgi:hypothetical protein